MRGLHPGGRHRSGLARLGTVDGAVHLTWGQYAEEVRRIAAGLAARGGRRGDTVALMLTNRPEFHLVDVAALHLGATPFSIYNSSSAEQIRYLLGDAGPRAVVTEAAFAARLAGAGADGPVLVDAPAEDPASLEALERDGDPGFDLAAAGAAAEPGDVATLIYTSGTTGPPKGVEVTHANVLAAIGGLPVARVVRPGDRVLSYLPAAHIAERNVCLYAQFLYRTEVVSVPDPRQVAAALAAVHPQLFFAVPSVWQKLRAAAEAWLAAQPGWAEDGLTAGLAAAVRTRLGLDRLRWVACGAAPVPPTTLEFFAGLGVPVLELWGMSETCGAGVSNTAEECRVGTVGRPQPGLEVSLAPDAELLARGPAVMRRYRNDPVRTAEAIDAEGWLHTGDLATIDADGFVTIIDRKKEIFINDAGKNMSPANIESAVRSADALLGSVVAIGDARPYVTALIVLEPAAAAAYATAAGSADTSAAALAADPALRAAVARAVAVANDRLSRVEQIKRFRILPAVWLPGGDELTPTMKLRRKPIAARYAQEIEELYATEPGPDVLEPASG